MNDSLSETRTEDLCFIPNEEDYENNSDYDELSKAIERTETRLMFEKMYSKIENFPKNIKNTIYFNAIIIGIVIICYFLALVQFKYFSGLLTAFSICLVAFLAIKTISLIAYFKNASFITFTGKIIESYPIGAKITNNLHFIIKLEDYEGKTLAFEYYDKNPLKFNQLITIFMREQSEISASDYGPFISSYIEVIPTDEIIAKNGMMDLQKELEKTELTIKDYLQQ